MEAKGITKKVIGVCKKSNKRTKIITASPLMLCGDVPKVIDYYN